MSNPTAIVVSKINSSATPLGAGGSFVGASENVSAYSEVDISLAGSPSDASGSLYFEFSPDELNWDVSVLVGGSALPGPSMPPQYLRIILPYFRVRYVNGSTPQTEFRLTTVFHRNSAIRLTRYLDQQIYTNEGVENVRAVLMGKNPGGDYINLPAGGAVPDDTTTALLGAGQTYTGGWVATTGYVSVAALVQSDQISAANGVIFEWSDTFGGSVRASISFSFAAEDIASTSSSHFYKSDNRGDFVRLRYVNGATPQTTFFAKMRLNTVSTDDPSLPVNGPIGNNQTGEAVNSILRHQLIGSGNFVSVSPENPIPALANQGTAAAVASGWPVKVTDGTDTVGISTVGGAKALKVDVVQSVGSGGGGTSSSFTAAFPSTGTASGFSDGSNMQGARVFDLDTSGSVEYVLGVGLRFSASGGSVEAGTSSHPIRIDPTGTTIQPVSGTVTANAGSGTFTVAGTVAATQSGTWTVQQGGSPWGVKTEVQLDYDTGGGTQNLSIIGIALPKSGGAVAGGTSTDPIRVDPTGATTQPVSGTVTANIGTTNGLALDATLTGGSAKTQIYDGSNVIGTAAHPVRTDPTGSTTQPVSGTVTSNQGSAAVVGSGWPVKITDGTDTVGISTVGGAKALKVDVVQTTGGAGSGGTSSNFAAAFPTAGTAAGFNDGSNMQGAKVFDADTGAGTEYVLGVELRQSASGGSVELGTSSHPIRVDTTGTTTQPVSGTVTANIGTTNGLALDTSVNGILVGQNSTTSGQSGPIVQGAVTTAAPSYTTAKTSPLSLTTAGALRVDGSAVTQPVSGTVTSNIGTTNGLALDATLTGGSAKTQLYDGASTYIGTKTGQLPASLVGGRLDANVGAWLGSTAPTVGAKTSANSLPVVIASDQAAIPVTISAGTDRTSTGTITSNQNIAVSTQASGACGIKITGVWTGTLVFESSVDGSNWDPVNAIVPTTGAEVTNATANGVWTVACAGFEQIRVRGNTVSSGAATVFLNSSTATQTVILGDPLPTGSNVIGGVTQSGTWTVQPGNTANSTPWLFTISQGGNSATVTGSNALKVDGSAVTQPISGTVTANIGTTNGLALDTSVNGILVSQGSTTSGEKGPLVQGAVTTAAPSYTTGQTSPLSITTGGLLRVDGSGVTQPVSGTVTANIGTTNGLALDATLTGGSAKTIVRGGAKGTTTAGDVTSTNVDSNTQALDVYIKGGGAAGGTSSTFGSAFPATGTATGFTDGSNMQGARVFDVDSGGGTQYVIGVNLRGSSSGGSIEIGTGSNPVRTDPTGTTTQPVSGTVTANQGGAPWTVTGTLSDNTANSTAKVATIPAKANTSAPSWSDGNMVPLSVIAGTGALRSDASSWLGSTAPTVGSKTSANSIPVVIASDQSAVTVTGTITANLGTTEADRTAIAQSLNMTATTNTVALTAPGTGTASVQITGATWTGTIIFEATTDGANWYTINAVVPTTGAIVTTTTANGQWIVACAGYAQIRCRCSVTGSNSATVSIEASAGAQTTSLINSLPVGSNVIGGVTQSGTWTVQPGNSANTTPWLFTINQGGNSAAVTGSNALKVDGSAVTQPVSGTITANIGTSGSLALDTSVNGILLSQGSTTSGQKGPLIQGAVTTSAPTYSTGQTSPLSLTTSGALRIDGSATTQPVSGTVTANQGGAPWTVTGTLSDNAANSTAKIAVIAAKANTSAPSWTDGNMAPLSVIAGTGALRADVSSWLGSTAPTVGSKTSANSIPVVIASDQGAVAISGTVTANIGTSGSLALDTSVNGILVSQGSTTSGQKGPLIQGAVTTSAPSYTTAQTSPLSLTTAGALRVDGSAVTQPVSGTVTANAGSGTFTVSGTVTANIGTTNGLALDATLAKLTIAQSTALGSNTQALMGGSVTTAAPSYSTGNINPLSLTTSGLLRVDGSGVTQPVSGTVTSNQGGAPWTVTGTLSDNTANSTAKVATIPAKANTAAPSWTDGNMAPLSVIAGTGALRSDVSSWLGSTAPTVGSKTGANSIPVVVASDQSYDVSTSGSITAASSFAAISVGQLKNTSPAAGTFVAISLRNHSVVLMTVTGTLTGGALTFEGTADGTNWFTMTGTSPGVPGGAGTTDIIANNSNGAVIRIVVAGCQQFRLRAVSGTTGLSSLTVAMNASTGNYPALEDVLQIDSLGGINVSGSFPTGSSVSANPVYVGGTDSGGLGRFILTDTNGRVEVTQKAASGATTSVAASASNVTILASNTARLGATVFNESASATLYLKLGSASSTSSYTVQILPNGYYETPYGYTGILTGTWSAAVGNARICEVTN